jgi:hypothetical protein
MRFNIAAFLALVLGLLIYLVVLQPAKESSDSKLYEVPKRKKSERPSTVRIESNLLSRQFTPKCDQDELRLLEELAAKDPNLAISQIEKIGDPDSKSLALRSVAAGWGRVDPHAAAKWLEGLDPEEQGVDAVLGLVPSWVERSADECLKWARQLPAGNIREISLVQIADSWTSVDPRAALTEYFKLEPEDGTHRGLHIIAAQWALYSPEVAIHHINSLKNEPRHEEFLQTALVSLTNKDPMMAWRYSDRFSNPAVVEHVRGMALEAMSETNPQDAIILAEKHGNTEKLLSGIARGWAMLDEKAAKTWAASIQDPEISARLIQSIGPAE